MYIVFQIRFNVSSGVMVILRVLHADDPGSSPMEGDIFLSSYFHHFYIYIFYNKSLVAFYIKFNALAKSSHQPLFINFQIQTHYHSYGYRYAVMSDILISKVFNKIHSITICGLCALTPHFIKFTFWYYMYYTVTA